MDRLHTATMIEALNSKFSEAVDAIDQLEVLGDQLRAERDELARYATELEDVLRRALDLPQVYDLPFAGILTEDDFRAEQEVYRVNGVRVVLLGDTQWAVRVTS